VTRPESLRNSQWDHWLPWLIVALIAGWLIRLLSPILTPFAVAAALAYLGDPLTDRLQALGLSRTLAVIVVFVGMTVLLIGGLLGLIPLLETQINYLIQRIPDYWNWLAQTMIPWLNQRLGISLAIPEGAEIISLLREHWQSAGSLATMLVSSVTQSGMAVIGWLLNLTLIPVLTFYFLRDWDGMMASIRELLPRSAEAVIVRLAGAADSVLAAFIRGQLLVMLALALIYAIGLSLMGLKLALLIGLLAGLLSIVPYLGSIIGIAAALLAAAVQFGDWLHLLLAAGVFLFGQMLEGMVLTPWLVGDRIGLHPVAVIFAIMAGGILFGFLGVLLALPVAAVAMVLVRFAHETYTGSYLYQGNREAPVTAEQPQRAEYRSNAEADSDQVDEHKAGRPSVAAAQTAAQQSRTDEPAQQTGSTDQRTKRQGRLAAKHPADQSTAAVERRSGETADDDDQH
jgi:predicted PurR-regulated permease PerM